MNRRTYILQLEQTSPFELQQLARLSRAVEELSWDDAKLLKRLICEKMQAGICMMRTQKTKNCTSKMFYRSILDSYGDRPIEQRRSNWQTDPR